MTTMNMVVVFGTQCS